MFNCYLFPNIVNASFSDTANCTGLEISILLLIPKSLKATSVFSTVTSNHAYLGRYLKLLEV